MTTMRWFGTGRSARGAPTMRGAFSRRSLTLLLVAVVSLFEAGCQSGFSGFTNPCGAKPCGTPSCGSCGYFTRLRERIFNRSTSTYYGPTLGAEAPLDATPVVTPGPAITTTPSAVPVVPAAPSADSPTDLAPLGPSSTEKAPTAIPGPPSDASPTGAKSSGNRANYEATGARNRYGRTTRGDNLTRTMVTTSEPASRSARGDDSALPPAEPAESLLENLPPVEVPHEWNGNDAPVASAAGTPKPPAEQPKPTPDQADEPPTETAAAGAADVSVVPGIRRFSVVEPKLAGGSLPSATGLDWLAEKGYKTILDLRDTADVQASFIEEVTKRGLRYVVLPMGLTQIDSSHVARFNDELALADARPLYFCDADGSRAGVLWYIRRMTVDRIDAPAASREAETLGLSDKAYWQAATKYLESLNVGPATGTPAQAPAPAANPPAPTTAVPPAAKSANAEPPMPDPAPAAAVKPADDPKSQTPKPTTQASATDTQLASKPAEVEEPSRPRDPTSWHSYAALMVTGLGVPLAYWSRSALPSLRILSKASLPSPARKAKSIPASSGD